MSQASSTAILDNHLPYTLTLTHIDASITPHQCIINRKKAEELKFAENDYIKILGKKHRTLLLACQLSDNIDYNAIFLHKDSRTNLISRITDSVKCYKIDEPKIISTVEFSPIEDTIENIEGDFNEAVIAYFQDLLPISTHSIVKIICGIKTIEFRVGLLTCNGEKIDFGIVNSETTFFTDQPVKRTDVEREFNKIGYDDVGGCREQMAKIRELIELPLRHPILFKELGVNPPKGVLLYGPPGTGKTLIARAIANELNLKFFSINGPEIMSKMAGESEANLRKIFEEASKEPSIIFIDEIDSLAPKRSDSQGEVEKRIVAQLLTLMDGIKKNKIIVLAATNRVNTIDPALRRYGRFDRELEIGIPNETGRYDILRIHTKNMKIDESVDLKEISRATHGFVGSDIASLCAEAALSQIRDKLQYIDLDNDKINITVLNNLAVNSDDFKYAIEKCDPSSLRENQLEKPNVSWADIGGLESVKKNLIESVEHPILYKEAYGEYGLEAPKGVLLYGPPGCGKTLLAKAVATNAQANFISIKGPELLNKYVGQSEENIRVIFERARNAAPCILFFDEIDSIATKRESQNEIISRILNMLLTEMDGLSKRKSIFIIGATNRPHLLDRALIRPGRLDQLIYIPLPDYESRVSIFQSVLSKYLVKDIDYEILANMSNGMSGADIKGVCQFCCKEVLNRYIKSGVKEELGMDVLVRHIKKWRRSVNESDISAYEQFRRDESVKEEEELYD